MMRGDGDIVRTYRDLKVWRMGIDLTRQVYSFTAELPTDERFGLVQQMCRAAVSIPSNIAEGHARGATRDFARFIAMARGSLAELETQLEICRALEYSPLFIAELEGSCQELGRALTGLRKSLDSKLAARATMRPSH
jgi:four helix bundle protein